MTKGRRFAIAMTVVCAALAVSLVAAVSVGSTSVGFADIWGALTGAEAEGGTGVIIALRLRRAFLGAVVGASLSVAGVALQALLRNSLAEPYILGVSGGAGVGAAIVTTVAAGLAAAGAGGAAAGSLYAMLSAAGFSLRALAAFAGAVAASFVVLSFGRRRGHIMPSTLLLVGVMVNAVCGSVILGLTYLADPARSHEIVIWLMGNLGTLSLPAGAIAVASIAAVAAAVLLWRLGGRLNVMSLGDEEAMHLGVRVARTRMEAFVLAAFVTALSVALAGPIGFVGLVVPHITRLLVGADHRVLFPVSFVSGAAFLVLADTAARRINPGNPLPVGVVTAAIGAPFFVWLLRARRGRYFE